MTFTYKIVKKTCRYLNFLKINIEKKSIDLGYIQNKIYFKPCLHTDVIRSLKHTIQILVNMIRK